MTEATRAFGPWSARHAPSNPARTTRAVLEQRAAKRPRLAAEPFRTATFGVLNARETQPAVIARSARDWAASASAAPWAARRLALGHEAISGLQGLVVVARGAGR